MKEQGKEKKLRKRKQGEDRMEQYTVTGMSCAACSSRVEDVYKRQVLHLPHPLQYPFLLQWQFQDLPLSVPVHH